MGRAGRRPSGEVSAALALTGATPDASQWRRFVSALLLWLGALLIAAGVIFFFAYNWHALGRFTKFGLVEGLLALSVIAAWIAGPDKAAGKASLLLRQSAHRRAARAHRTDVSDRRRHLRALRMVGRADSAVDDRRAASGAVDVVARAAQSRGHVLLSRRSEALSDASSRRQSLVWALCRPQHGGAHRMGSRRLGAVYYLDAGPVAGAPASPLAERTSVTFLGLWAIFEASAPDRFAIPAYFAWARGLPTTTTGDRLAICSCWPAACSASSCSSRRGSQDALLAHGRCGSLLLNRRVVIGMSAAGAWWLKGIASRARGKKRKRRRG
jgi:hypothetical protein